MCFFTQENQTRRYRRWRYDESFDGERDDLFDSNDKLAMIIHGFTDNANRPWMPQMRDALYLQEEPERVSMIEKTKKKRELIPALKQFLPNRGDFATLAVAPSRLERFETVNCFCLAALLNRD